MPSANSLTHFHTGTIIQACWCLQNRVISPSKLFTTTSCYVLWIYFLHVLLLDSVALLPFKENIYDNVGLMHFFFHISLDGRFIWTSDCQLQHFCSLQTVDTSITRPIFPGNLNQLLISPSDISNILPRRECGPVESAGLRRDLHFRMYSVTEQLGWVWAHKVSP